ncbi:MAG: hypothetical protein WC891_08925 [Actinomycetota bacterium]
MDIPTMKEWIEVEGPFCVLPKVSTEPLPLFHYSEGAMWDDPIFKDIVWMTKNDSDVE